MDTAGKLVAFALISGLIGAIIGGTKGKGGAGFVLGALLGPIGWLIAAVLTPTADVAVRREKELEAARARYDAQKPPVQQQPTPQPPADPWDTGDIQRRS